MYWQKLPANLAQISATGGKRVHRTQYTYTVQTFNWLLLSFAAESSASGPQSGKAPYHSLPLPHLFYLYISGGGLLTLWGCLPLLTISAQEGEGGGTVRSPSATALESPHMGPQGGDQKGGWSMLEQGHTSFSQQGNLPTCDFHTNVFSSCSLNSRRFRPATLPSF